MNNIYLDELLSRYNALSSIKTQIAEAFDIIKDCFINNNILYICGNGGSASDAEHIVGELMKAFILKRKIKNNDFINKMEEKYGKDSHFLINSLQEGLRAISLTGQPSLSTAFANDVCPELVFAQQIYVLGKPGDVLLGISTSGNSKNVLHALKIASAKKLKTILLTGKSGGKGFDLVDCSINAPSDVTYMIQEYHLPIYHTLCLMLEEYFYGDSCGRS